jgi:hypothetical protein
MRIPWVPLGLSLFVVFGGAAALTPGMPIRGLLAVCALLALSLVWLD